MQTFISDKLQRPFHHAWHRFWSSKDEPNSVHIYTVNYLTDPAFVASSGKILPQARSQIELFHHTIETSEAKHLRSIWHPLIRTPNEIYARNGKSIFVTNDHQIREGLWRTTEDILLTSDWSDIVYLKISDMNPKNSSEGMKIRPAKRDIQNPNGERYPNSPSSGWYPGDHPPC